MTLCPAAESAEFRAYNLIPTPKVAPEKTRPVAQFQPVDRAVIEGAVQRFVNTWNTTAMDEMLDEMFYDRTRLQDNMSSKVPRDARLRLLSISMIQVLDQFVRPDPSGGSVMHSTISATLRTQIEFNDPALGFQRIEGINDLIFEIAQKLE
jgi:hypothetical protein